MDAASLEHVRIGIVSHVFQLFPVCNKHIHIHISPWWGIQGTPTVHGIVLRLRHMCSLLGGDPKLIFFVWVRIKSEPIFTCRIHQPAS
jgi:hypothetical protein